MATETETVYTLTDADGWTRRACANALHWGEGVTHTATGTDGVVHWYDSPELAAMMDPIHGCYGADAICWRATVADVVDHDGVKGGSRSLTTVERVPLPALTTLQRVEVAIRVSLLCKDGAALPERYLAWAHRWLDGTDRSAATAWAAVRAAEKVRLAVATAWPAEAAVRAAARAAWAAVRAWAPVEDAAAAADAAADAAEASMSHTDPRGYAAAVTRIIRDILDRDGRVGHDAPD